MTRDKPPWTGLGSAAPLNPLGMRFMQDLEADYSEHGAETIARIRKNEPRNYLRILLSLAPPRPLTSQELFAEMDDRELANLIQLARAVLAAQEEDTEPD